MLLNNLIAFGIVRTGFFCSAPPPLLLERHAGVTSDHVLVTQQPCSLRNHKPYRACIFLLPATSE